MKIKPQRKWAAIPQRSIRKFMARKRRDYRVWKRKSLAELQAYCDDLPERPPIWKRLKKHQRVCLIIGILNRFFCFWNDTGTGKTLLSLSLMLYFRKIGLVKRNLVLVPNRINKDEWRRDVAKHSPNTQVLILEGSSEDKWAALKDHPPMIILETYGGLLHLLCSTEMVKKRGKKAVPKMVIDKKKVDALRKIIQGLYMDESIMVIRKTRFGSLTHRLCRRLSDTAETVFALNGTPFGRDPTDLHGQVLIVDQGYTLGETLGLFRAAFFDEIPQAFGGPKYKFIKALEPTLHDFMANISIRYEAEAADLPRVVPIRKEVSLTSDAKSYYEKAKQAVMAAHGNYRAMENAFIRMRQVSSGFVGYYDDEDGSKCKYEFERNPKLESCISYIEEIERNHKSVVFHEFRYSGDMLARELKKLGIGHARIYGASKDADGELEAFAKDDDCRVLLLQNASGGYGLDRVKVAKYALYFESPVGTVLRKQTRRRVERQYSDHATVFIVDFVTHGTVDVQILEAHEEGFDLFARIVEGRERPK